jgi:hypothetical protein
MAQTGITGTGMTCSQQTVLYRASFERNAILFFIACFKTIQKLNGVCSFKEV